MSYISTTQGIGGIVKSSPEDFIVREIQPNGLILKEGVSYTAEQVGDKIDNDGKFTKFVLQKKNWDTVRVLMEISKLLHRGKKSIAYYGTKDKVSISVQMASIFGVDPEQVLALHLADTSINCAWKSATEAQLGINLGNSFTATIRNCKNTDNISQILSELDGRFPNYFDKQRFGMRMNNHLIGMKIIRSDFEGAVMQFLTDTNLERNEEATAARKRLEEERDFKQALQYFPRSLRNERAVIEYLARYGDNYANALRKIPRGIVMMFIHSVQSLIFNEALDSRIKNGDFKSQTSTETNSYGFPNMDSISSEGEFPIASLPGYETKPDLIDDYEKEIMEKLEIKQEDFKIKGIPELSMKGAFRTILAPVKDASFESAETLAKINFSIPAGSYATIFLNEITKTEQASI